MTAKKRSSGTREDKANSAVPELQKIYDWLSGPGRKATLPQEQRMILQVIVSDLIAGVDPREWLHIRPKVGRPKRFERRDRYMAGHYWALRRAGEKDEVARQLVGKTWGVGTEMVWKISRPRRSAWQKNLAAPEFANYLEMAPEIASIIRQVQNSR